MADSLPVMAIVGGTGDLGTGLALRWAEAGYRVIIGSRTIEKAEHSVAEVHRILVERGIAGARVTAMENRAAAAAADIAVLTVPFENQVATLETIREAIKGKILIDVTVPLMPPRVARVQLPAGGSAVQAAQQLLGADVRVVGAFQNVAAADLLAGHQLDCDVLVSGDNKEAREEVIDLVRAAGMRGVHAGSTANSAAAEALTSVLIFINKHYGCRAGIRVTGIAADEC